MVYPSFRRVAVLPGLILWAALGSITSLGMAMEPVVAQGVESDTELSQVSRGVVK